MKRSYKRGKQLVLTDAINDIAMGKDILFMEAWVVRIRGEKLEYRNNVPDGEWEGMSDLIDHNGVDHFYQALAPEKTVSINGMDFTKGDLEAKLKELEY